MKRNIIIFSCLLTIMLSGCTPASYDLEQSLFVEDINNPGLPEYSEWGYNTFGAYIDRSEFVSNNVDLPAKIIVSNDTFNIRLSGKWKSEPMTIKFGIKGYKPNDFPDLAALNDSIFDLTGENCSVTMTYKGKNQKLNVYFGKVHFKRVQLLYVDKEQSETILSGYFDFKTFLDGEPIAVSKGRFDLGIGYDNFYKF